MTETAAITPEILMRIRTFLLATPFLLLGDPAAAQTAAQLEALESGKTAGSSAVQSIYDGISHDQGASVIRNYSTTPPTQSSYWGGDHTAINPINASGTAKVAECDTGGTLATAEDAQHCEAVNAIAKQPALKPAPLVDKSDPLYTTGRAISANPEAVAGAIETAYSECTTTTETTSPEKTTETCEDFAENGDAKCSIGPQITVDADHLYRCKDSVKVTENTQCTVGRTVVMDKDANYQCAVSDTEVATHTCDKTLNVTVTWSSSCLPGTWIRLATISKNSYDKVVLELYCDPDRQDGYHTFRTYAYGLVGACTGWQQATLPINAPGRNNWARLSPHWDHACRTGYPAWHGAGSCTGNTCTKHFEWGGSDGAVVWSFTTSANPVYTKPYNYYTTTESWIDGCGVLESRTQ